MITRMLHGLQWHVYSPSMYRLAHVDLWIAFDGYGWRVGHMPGFERWGDRSFAVRDQAMQLVVDGFNNQTIGG